MIEEMMINSFGPGLVPLLFTIMIGQKTKKTNFKKRASGLWWVAAVRLLLKLKLINFRCGSRTATDKP